MPKSYLKEDLESKAFPSVFSRYHFTKQVRLGFSVRHEMAKYSGWEGVHVTFSALGHPFSVSCAGKSSGGSSNREEKAS